MKADYVHKDSRTLEEKPQVFARWIDPTIEELQQENQSLKKENKILRENAENNDKVVDKVNWENQLLKKQLEENKDKINWYENFEINKTIDKLRIKHNNQQKEFIKSVEYQVKSQEELNDIHLATGFEEILQKYKSIIGDIDENN